MHTADPRHRVPHLAFQPDRLSDLPILPMAEVESAYYLRMRLDDRPGVLADVTRILAELTISIEAMVQKEPAEGESQVDVVMLTELTREKHIDAAIARMEALPVLTGKITRIRLEMLGTG
jgi:homoserine dehydrogenase